MSVSLDTVQAKIRDLVLQSGTNTRVIFVAPNAPRPELPYTVIEYEDQAIQGFDDECFDTDTDKLRLYGRRIMNFVLFFYGESSLDEATKVKSMFSFQTSTDILSENNDVSMAIAECDDIEYDYILRDDTYEKVCTFGVRLNVVMEPGSTFIEPGYFDTVDPFDWINKPN